MLANNYKKYKKYKKKQRNNLHDDIKKEPKIIRKKKNHLEDTIDNTVLSIVAELSNRKIKMRELSSDKFPYQHIACFVVQFNISSIGENSTREAWCGCKYGTHAEVEAMQRLPPPQSNTIKRKYADLLVIRVDFNGNLRNSKPCSKCIEYLSKLRTYRIKNVYYSNENGDIIMVKFTDLLHSKDMHISRRFR